MTFTPGVEDLGGNDILSQLTRIEKAAQQNNMNASKKNVRLRSIELKCRIS